MTDIYTALAAVMADCKAVVKRDRNTHQNFMFRGIDAVVNAVGPILRQHGVIVTPNVESVSYETVSTSTGKPSTACRVLATYTFHAPDGSSIDTRVAGEAWDHGDKATPKAMSVAFRTALLQSLALPTDDPDPDTHTYERAASPQGEQASPVRSQTSGVSEKQLGMMGALMKECGITDRAAALSYVASVIGRSIESRNELTSREASSVIDRLKSDAAR